MTHRILPNYPIYIPSKGRADCCYTAKCLDAGEVPFHLVIEPQEEALYRVQFPSAHFLILPWNGDDQVRRDFCQQRRIENGGLIAARNWIKEHATATGSERHWQLDDNITEFYRRYKGKRIRCESGLALRACEDFTDRYENVAISGLNYYMFVMDDKQTSPLVINCHVYSCSLILNALPFCWRLAYNDDTDICLQVLSTGIWCTVLINVFMCRKLRTMTVQGGNTADLYQGDGRLHMARSLERVWPGIVETKRRFHRPQHVIKENWKCFDTPLRLKPDIDLTQLPPTNEYGMDLCQIKDVIKSPRIQRLHDAWQQTHRSE